MKYVVNIDEKSDVAMELAKRVMEKYNSRSDADHEKANWEMFVRVEEYSGSFYVFRQRDTFMITMLKKGVE